MTKVQAIAAVIAANNGRATLVQIYQQSGRYYKGVKASAEWKAGLRGVLYRELRNGRSFRKIGIATYALRK